MTISVVPAAGLGRRLNPTTPVPKALQPLCGKPLISWVMATLERVPVIDGIVVVVPPGNGAAFEALRQREGWQKPCQFVDGGADRQQSVWQGLRALPPETEWVIVHDAARPLVTPALVLAVWEAAREIGSAAIAALPCTDTVKRSLDGALIAETLDRQQLWLAQTPQAFAADILLTAHEQAIQEGYTATDDAMLVERLGVPVRLVLGDPTNLKVTYPTDLCVAEALLKLCRREVAAN
ncbi:2-C-methyl-D-erythritol 4-phosphate cytidylyltransferase [bacterium HR17]|uniref:2-C-methyl-D-erythritol 4-phosphate cytidylyltransferase n=1 Tax=Candidatus Fervidibacter japonicus TaxID=2035412 RepID=A0A2H5X9B3_9BACT|nr:2-C-methyl-D-erythritol 4-phosphate cytidylyltransferase [bacterium HR17]